MTSNHNHYVPQITIEAGSMRLDVDVNNNSAHISLKDTTDGVTLHTYILHDEAVNLATALMCCAAKLRDYNANRREEINNGPPK